MVLRRSAERAAKQIIWLGYLLLPIAGFSFAWWLRFRSGLFEVVDFQPFPKYHIPIIIVAAFWAIVYRARGLHNPDFSVNFWREGLRIIWASILAMILPMALAFTYRGYFYSRLVMIMGAGTSAILCFAYKQAVKSILRKMVLRKIGVARKLIIGCDNFAQQIIDSIRKDRLSAAGLVGMVSIRGERCTADLPYLGELENLREILISGQYDEVILASPQVDEQTILKIIYECRKEQVQFSLVPKFWHLLKGRVSIEQSGELRVIAFKDLALKGWQRTLKRIMDIVVSLVMLVVLSPLFGLIALLIKVTSKGPVFFKQERIGRNGRKFIMLKFRSMYEDAEKRLEEYLAKNEVEGPIFKIKDDPRITPVGKFLRRYSLDELPQLINVLLGQMSLVGPRPPLEREVKEYEEWQLRRIDVTPGMTGLWQVSGRSDLPFSQMVQLDIYYIEHWSIWLDIKILLKTIPAVLSGKGAY